MSAALMRLPAARAAIGCKSNATLRKWCERWDIPIVEINSRSKAVLATDLERSLLAAAGKEASDVA